MSLKRPSHKNDTKMILLGCQFDKQQEKTITDLQRNC